jgi:hypothetical protein
MMYSMQLRANVTVIAMGKTMSTAELWSYRSRKVEPVKLALIAEGAENNGTKPGRVKALDEAGRSFPLLVV